MLLWLWPTWQNQVNYFHLRESFLLLNPMAHKREDQYVVPPKTETCCKIPLFFYLKKTHLQIETINEVCSSDIRINSCSFIIWNCCLMAIYSIFNPIDLVVQGLMIVDLLLHHSILPKQLCFIFISNSFSSIWHIPHPVIFLLGLSYYFFLICHIYRYPWHMNQYYRQYK